MKTTPKNVFCTRLADWLLSTQWHFTTLATITIESVHPIPKEVEQLVNRLVLEFPQKPTKNQLIEFLVESSYVRLWFNHPDQQPFINALNLSPITSPKKQLLGLPQLTSITDLASWLNVSLGELQWLANLKRPETIINDKLKHYHYHVIDKKRGGIRLIESPKPLLKEIQQKINTELLSALTVHDAAHGFRKGRNHITHATNHCGKKALILFDISNCFHSISWQSIYNNVNQLGYAKEITKYVTGLCTHHVHPNEAVIATLEASHRKLILKPHLPQGAPSSPTLSNSALHHLDKRLTGLAKTLNLTYSRYADDLAFSSNEIRDWRFLEHIVGAICLEEGLQLNHRKSRILKSQQRQKLTGLVVNKTPNIDRRHYDNLKATLTNCVQYGLESQNREKHEFFYEHLTGAVNYVCQINPHRGAKLRKILRKIKIDNRNSQTIPT